MLKNPKTRNELVFSPEKARSETAALQDLLNIQVLQGGGFLVLFFFFFYFLADLFLQSVHIPIGGFHLLLGFIQDIDIFCNLILNL